ncbi:uncharacterized protein LOC109847777 [Asparagus officinalis]|uniref:uncharacterized protein LOC109847777 n=1 Tax=Asparagus officinalis TaxID=4686 RepID=UPI00098E5242|nr:uncharacterized protein LOC109847777 [Asparagus officinalis]
MRSATVTITSLLEGGGDYGHEFGLRRRRGREIWGGERALSQPPPFTLSPSHRHQKPNQNPNPSFSFTSRRAALLLLSLPSLIAQPPPSTAISLGISGPKEWLRGQKKKAARYVLDPIVASQRSLRSAYLLMTSEAVDGVSEEIKRLLNSARRDCVPQERSSVVAFQARSGVEVCTFKLIVKNAASLLDDSDPVKLEAEDRLDVLIRSFSALGTTVDKSDFRLNADREKVKEGLTDSIYALGKFGQAIKDCLGV